MSAEPMVAIPLRVLSDLIVALDRGQTSLGHPAQVVDHESWGICSVRHGCSETCPERRALFMEARAIEKRAYAELDGERLEQLPFAATTTAAGGE